MFKASESMELTVADVARRVRPYVAGKHVGDVALYVDEEHIHQRNGFWRIPVRPSRWPEPLFPYYDALALIEDDVQEKEHLDVNFISGEPIAQI